MKQRVKALASELRRTPTSTDLQNAGIYIYHHFSGLEDLYSACRLMPPAGLCYVSLKCLRLFESEYEGKVAEQLAELLLKGEVAWLVAQWKPVLGRQFSVDFLVITRCGAIALVEADGYHSARRPGRRYSERNEKTDVLRDAADRVGGSVVLVAKDNYQPVVGRIVKPRGLAKALRALRPRSVGATKELREVLRGNLRPCGGARSLRRCSAKSGVEMSPAPLVAAAFEGVQAYSDGDLDSVIAGQRPDPFFSPRSFESRLRLLLRWDADIPRPIGALRRLLGVGNGLKRLLEAAEAKGQIGSVPGPKGTPCYSPSEVDGLLDDIEIDLRPPSAGSIAINRLAKRWQVGREEAVATAGRLNILRRHGAGAFVVEADAETLKSALEADRASRLLMAVAHYGLEAAEPSQRTSLISLPKAAKQLRVTRKVVERLVLDHGIRPLVVQPRSGTPFPAIPKAAVADLRIKLMAALRSTHGATPNTRPTATVPNGHIDRFALAEALSSSALSVGPKVVLRFAEAGLLHATFAVRVSRGWKVLFNKRDALRAAEHFGLPVPDHLVTEGLAAERLGVAKNTLQMRVTTSEVAHSRLVAHETPTSGGKQTRRFYDPDELDRSVDDGWWNRSRKASRGRS